jgi:hypothetical protein
VTVDNPYSPPTATVRDAKGVRLIAERPRQIVHATALLWISFVIGMASAWVQSQTNPEPLPPLAMVALLAFALTLSIVINVAVWRGRNWARILYAILTVIAIVSLPFDLATSSGVSIAMDAIAYVLDAVIVFLLFTKPGSLWFRYASDRPAS